LFVFQLTAKELVFAPGAIVYHIAAAEIFNAAPVVALEFGRCARTAYKYILKLFFFGQTIFSKKIQHTNSLFLDPHKRTMAMISLKIASTLTPTL
jgi:hypothetical protein